MLNWGSEIIVMTLECSIATSADRTPAALPIFGAIRADILQFLLELCPIASVPTNEFFPRKPPGLARSGSQKLLPHSAGRHKADV